MAIQVPQKNQSESAADLALTLSDLLYSQGERTRARALLELFEPGERDERLTTRLADDALEQGDAPRALKLLARVWEGGSLNPYVEARLALAALAVGLTERITSPWKKNNCGMGMVSQQHLLKPRRSNHQRFRRWKTTTN